MGRKKAAKPAAEEVEEVPEVAAEEVPAEVVWDETNDPFGLRRQATKADARSPRSPTSSNPRDVIAAERRAARTGDGFPN